MRIEAKLPLTGVGTSGRAVQSVGGVHPLKPMAVHACQAQEAVHPHRQSESGAPDGEQAAWHGEEHRKMNRRVSLQLILIELRSGRDRRRQVQCDDELCAHLDAEA